MFTFSFLIWTCLISLVPICQRDPAPCSCAVQMKGKIRRSAILKSSALYPSGPKISSNRDLQALLGDIARVLELHRPFGRRRHRCGCGKHGALFNYIYFSFPAVLGYTGESFSPRQFSSLWRRCGCRRMDRLFEP